MHQDALLEMTQMFLERDGNGARFWPDDPTSPEYRGLKYSTHCRDIKRGITQLFWRLSQQNPSLRPQRLSNPSQQAVPTSHPLDPSGVVQLDTVRTARERGQSPEDPIDVDGQPLPITPSTASVPVITHSNATSSTTGPPPTQSVSQLHTERSIDESRMQGTRERSSTLGPAPMANGPSDGLSSSGEAITSAESGRNGKRPATQFEGYQKPPEAKRSRQHQHSPVESGGRRADVDPWAEFTTGSWFSPSRNRKQTHREGYITGVAFLEATASDGEGDDGSSPTSHLRTPPPNPRQGTVDTVGRHNGDFLVQNVVSIEDSEERRPATPPAPRERDLEPLDTFAPEHEVEDDPLPLPDQVPEPRLESSRERELSLQSDPSPGNAHEHAPGNAPEPGAKHTIDYGVNSQPSKQRQKPVNLIFSAMTSRDTNETLNLQGGFLRRSLQNLLEELPIRGRFLGLSFMLKTPKMTFKDNVSLGDEEKFENLKIRFQEKVAAACRGRQMSGGLRFEISIEPHWVDGNIVEEVPIF
ncbi:hypothetical protein G7Z17_g7514 [Cylindrodendrum hubeiense]|uniref:Uncharacterized protein n=1 Tax=Cylindrodendrum hubeiense TaxID=595255 RepID=A0A9P5LF88_9HYPO|nr:hypothetical protein G7Z17_g7514 [Cylindrodendrum hubeiense]